MANEDDDKTLPDDQQNPTNPETGEGEDAEKLVEELNAKADEGDELDDDDLALLTDEERAALEGDDEDGEAEEDEADDADADPAPADAPPVDAQTQPDPQPEPQRPAQPQVDAAALNAAVADAKQKKAALFAQYEDGELTRDQYLAQIDAIDNEAAQATAQLALAQQQQDAARTEWTNTARAYLAEVPELRSPEHVDAFDAHVRRVTSDPRSEGLTFRQMLEKAHRYYLADQPEVKAAIPPLPGKKAVADPARTTQRKPEPPITLARIPASAPATVSDGRFGQLQQLVDNATTAEEVERIMASMSEAEREAFASMDV